MAGLPGGHRRVASTVLVGTGLADVRFNCHEADASTGVPMSIMRLDHIQLAMPKGGEDHARGFYAGLLGIPETRKPPNLAARGGCWFEAGSLKIHLGVDLDFVPARKAHPAFVVNHLDGLLETLAAAGHAAIEDEPLAGYRRRYVCDPFGNRIEFMESLAD